MDRDNDLHPLAKKRRARLLPFPHCLNCRPEELQFRQWGKAS